MDTIRFLKNRIAEAQEDGKEVKQNMVNEVASSALVCFTDGLCLTNSGPCGAGAVIYHPEGNFDSIKRPVATHGSILFSFFFFLGGGGDGGGLFAILSMIEHLLSNSHQITRMRVASSVTVRLQWKSSL